MFGERARGIMQESIESEATRSVGYKTKTRSDGECTGR